VDETTLTEVNTGKPLPFRTHEFAPVLSAQAVATFRLHLAKSKRTPKT
jgi:hypothetical protein